MLMSGHEVNGKITELGESTMILEYQKKNGKMKQRVFELERVFSVQFADSASEYVVYKQDTSIGNFFTEQETRYFVYGEQDAIKGHKSPLGTVLGFVGGATGGYLLGG